MNRLQWRLTLGGKGSKCVDNQVSTSAPVEALGVLTGHSRHLIDQVCMNSGSDFADWALGPEFDAVLRALWTDSGHIIII